MASNEELERLVGKIVTDHAFRAKFANDPVGAAKSVHVSLTDDQAEIFKKNVHAFIVSATELDREMSKAAGHAIAVFSQ
jgi:hypothetical protein